MVGGNKENGSKYAGINYIHHEAYELTLPSVVMPKKRSELKPGKISVFWAEFVFIFMLHYRKKWVMPWLVILTVGGVLVYSLLIAFIYFQLPYEPQYARSLKWVVTLNTLYFTISSNIGCFNFFDHDRNDRLPCAMKTSAILIISPCAVWFGRYVAEMPFRIILIVLSTAIVYPIVGMRPGFQWYLLYQLAFILQTFANGAFGLNVTAICKDEFTATWVAIIFFSFNFIFSGALYTSNTVTWILLWLRYLSVSFYVGQIGIFSQFYNAIYPNSNITGNDLLDTYGWMKQPLSVSIVGLILLTLLFNVTGVFFLWLTSRSKKHK